ncbi:MAG: glycine zipper 2TM domain-containing protein [Sphingorhabdus sp.]
MKKFMLALAATTLVVPTAVLADPPAHARAHGYYKDKDRGYERGYREGRRDAQRVSSNTRVWRGNDGRTYCRRSDGTTGLLIGVAAGGVAGNVIAGRGDKTLGTILGAAAGGLLGREIDRSKYRCR